MRSCAYNYKTQRYKYPSKVQAWRAAKPVELRQPPPMNIKSSNRPSMPSFAYSLSFWTNTASISSRCKKRPTVRRFTWTILDLLFGRKGVSAKTMIPNRRKRCSRSPVSRSLTYLFRPSFSGQVGQVTAAQEAPHSCRPGGNRSLSDTKLPLGTWPGKGLSGPPPFST
jgi:hypothetical protein